MLQSRTKNSRIKAVLKRAGFIFLLVSRIILGLVFAFSGFVKVIDPLGLTYKIEDYLIAFGGVFENFTSLAFPISIALPALEFLLGLCLLFNIKVRIMSVFAFIFMFIMTSLTLYIALFNPVTDCGCFGDALIISNWQTFYKNVVLLVLAIVLMLTSRKAHQFFLPHVEWVAISLFLLLGISLSTYSYNHLPIIDFRPYKVGVNIPQAMETPQDAPIDEYETKFIYEKDGAEKEFTLENYPKGDTAWTFVNQQTVLISEGYKPPIHDFSIVNAQDEDITQDVITNAGEIYLLIMYDVNKASEKGALQAEQTYQEAQKTGTGFYVLTSSSDSDIDAFVKKTGVTYPFCRTDQITLKTIVRANPGLVLIKNGTITGKWHWRDF